MTTPSSLYNETQLIAKVITTPYERVLQILSKIRIFLQDVLSSSNSISMNVNTEIIDELDWVISKIKTQNLYSYEQNIDSEIIKQCQHTNSKLYQVVDYLTGNTELNRCSFERSDMYSKIRQELGLEGSDIMKKKSWKVEQAKMKEISDLKKEDIGFDFFNSKAMSYGYHQRVNSFDVNSHKNRPSLNLQKKNYGRNTINSLSNSANNTNEFMFSNKYGSGIMKLNYKSSLLLNSNNEDNGTDSNSNSDSNSCEFFNIEDDLLYNDNNKLQIIDINDNIQIEKQIYNSNTFTQNFDILEYKESHGYKNVLPFMASSIFSKFELDTILNKKTFHNFISAINNGYHESTQYHNSIHGADVSQTLSLYFIHSSLITGLKLTTLDLISIFSASLAHDLGHPGFNNSFHINSLSNIGIAYNDISVLENFHAAQLFRILKRNETNIYESFSQLEYRKARKRIINMILATDMFHHAKVFGVIRSKVDVCKEFKVELNENSNSLFEDQQEYLDFFIHLSDISHNAKPFKVTCKWVEMLNKEFFLQGDKEKEMGLKVSYLCDRNNVDLPKSQIGFINAFIIPSLEVLVKISGKLEFFLENAKDNLKMWEKLNEERQKDKDKEKKKVVNDNE